MWMTAETAAEELVYQVAAELGFTEEEYLRLDAARLGREFLGDLRCELKQEAGRPVTVEDFLLVDPKIITIEEGLRRLAGRPIARRPVS